MAGLLFWGAFFFWQKSRFDFTEFALIQTSLSHILGDAFLLKATVSLDFDVCVFFIKKNKQLLNVLVHFNWHEDHEEKDFRICLFSIMRTPLYITYLKNVWQSLEKKVLHGQNVNLKTFYHSFKTEL